MRYTGMPTAIPRYPNPVPVAEEDRLSRPRTWNFTRSLLGLCIRDQGTSRPRESHEEEILGFLGLA